LRGTEDNLSSVNEQNVGGSLHRRRKGKSEIVGKCKTKAIGKKGGKLEDNKQGSMVRKRW
jgi:hypothetical protein